MAVNTESGVTLSLDIDGVEYGCQLIEPQLLRPWAGEGDITVTACGENVVEPPASPERGSISGDAFADYSLTGISRGLDAALGQEVAITWTETTDDYTRTWTGVGLVLPISSRTWKSGGKLRHSIDISLTSETSHEYAAVDESS